MQRYCVLRERLHVMRQKFYGLRQRFVALSHSLQAFVDRHLLFAAGGSAVYSRFKTCFSVPLWFWIFCCNNMSAWMSCSGRGGQLLEEGWGRRMVVVAGSGYAV